MPSVSEAQRRLMALAEHNPSAVHKKNKGVLNMSHKQLHDYSKGSNLPEKVKGSKNKPRKLRQ